MEDETQSWTKAHKLQLTAILVTVLGLVLNTPESRRHLGLENSKTKTLQAETQPNLDGRVSPDSKVETLAPAKNDHAPSVKITESEKGALGCVYDAEGSATKHSGERVPVDLPKTKTEVGNDGAKIKANPYIDAQGRIVFVND
jgi:hypothetical protein